MALIRANKASGGQLTDISTNASGNTTGNNVTITITNVGSYSNLIVYGCSNVSCAVGSVTGGTIVDNPEPSKGIFVNIAPASNTVTLSVTKQGTDIFNPFKVYAV